LRLLLRNPEEFARNLKQVTDPAGFRRDLLDLIEIEPLNVLVDPAAAPMLNIVLPAIEPQKLTGGPNTVLNIGVHIAAAGVPVRFISSAPLPTDTQWFRKHLSALSGIPPDAVNPLLVSGKAPVTVGPNDLFMASFWVTAHQIAPLLQQMNRKRFFYVIQDFEPGFYPWSGNYARALQTYEFPFLGVINGAMLRLAAISDLILAVEPTADGFAEGLARGVAISADTLQRRTEASVSGVPLTWRESLADVVRMVQNEFAAMSAESH
jgi:hypothetical protein